MTETSFTQPDGSLQGIDRHQALKMGNREAIKLAALELARLRGHSGYTVTELAEKANVSRRTFFNHFGSIDDAIYAGLRDLVLGHFEELAKQLELVQVESLNALFGHIEAILLSANLDGLIREIQQTIGEDQKDSRAFAGWIPGVLNTVVEDLNELFASKLPKESHLRINLFSLTLLQAIIASSEECAHRNHPVTPEHWRGLLAEALGSLRGGFGA